VLGAVRGVQRELDVLAGGAGDLGEGLAVDGDGFSKYPPLLGGTNSPPMKLPYRSWTDTTLSD